MKQEAKFQVGDKLVLSGENEKIQSLLLHISEEDGVKWFGICFMSEEKLFGREIPKGFGKDTVTLFDISYLHEDIISSFEKIDHYNIVFDVFPLGSKSAFTDTDTLKDFYDFNVVQRRKKRSNRFQSMFSSNPVNECFIDVSTLIVQVPNS